MNDVDSANFWQEKYELEQFPWDLGEPAPPFVRLAENGRFPPGQMLVPGAGTGHDARLFARHGFAVTAVDFAPEAVTRMQQLDDPAHPVAIVQADMFALPEAWNGRFDYVLEYTCYCAIHPSRRDAYARLMHRLLKPSGIWIALAFPIGRRPGGPPYVVQPDQVVERMNEHEFSLLTRSMPADSAPSRQGIEELLIMQRK